MRWNLLQIAQNEKSFHSDIRKVSFFHLCLRPASTRDTTNNNHHRHRQSVPFLFPGKPNVRITRNKYR